MFVFKPSEFNRRRWLAVAGAGVILIAGLAIGGTVLWSWRQDTAEPQRGSEQSPAKALEADPALGSLKIETAASETEPIVTTDAVEISVKAPAGATEMQVGIDPTFTSTDWLAVTPRHTLTVRRSGYQSVFARFRTGPEAQPSVPIVVGVTIDPTFAQATSGKADEKKEPSWVRALSPNVVSVRIEDGRLVHGHQEPYDFDSPPSGDEVDSSGKRPSVTRNSEPYGTQVSGTNTVLKTHDRIVGDPIDGALVENATWTFEADDGTTMEAVAVDRVANVNGTGRDVSGDVLAPLVHDVFLEFENDLEVGVSYRLETDVEELDGFDYVHEPGSSVSPALHVNQLGFTSESETKVGYVSGYPTGVAAIDYARYQQFVVVDLESDEEVYSGRTTRRPTSNEVGKGDLTGADVYEADFSDLDRPGLYAFCLVEVGCSETFEIRDTVWLEATTEVARAMYHQRSGVALGPPYSSIARPRPYHPDDGVDVHASSYSILDGLEEPLEDIFAGLVREQTDVAVPEAWGGHFDAGDWDRRIQHLWYVRSAAQLVETYPDVFGRFDLNIPESGDGVPDVLDEAMWSLDAYRRMQTSDGGIRGGVEASEHPQARDSSWTDDLAVFAFEPDPWSSYLYAGVAAELSLVLEPYDEAKADVYEESALQAMAWAESQPEHETKNEKVQAQRTVAAAALLKHTGDKKWHDLFVDGTSFDSTSREFLSCHGHDICDAAWLYVTADPTTTDPDIRDRVVDSFVISADDVVVGTESTSFGWALEDRNIPLVWGLGPGGNPSSVGLMRAFSLTGDEKYRSAAVRSASATLGANPRNTVYVTGLGATPVQHPLIVDSVNGGLPVWSGTPVFGPHELNALNDESWVTEHQLKPTGAYPDVDTLPYLWQWQDASNVAMFNEYTVHQSHAGALYAFGMLAGSYS